MFADTLTLTIAGAAQVLTRVRQDDYSSEYRLRGDNIVTTLKIRNTSFKDRTRANRSVDRHNVEVVRLSTVDPLNPTQSKSYFTFEVDTLGPVSGQEALSKALVGFLTDANLLKLINFES